MEAVARWLESLGLGEYAPAIAKAGYDDLALLSAVLAPGNAEEAVNQVFEELGVKKPGHRMKLKMQAAKLGADEIASLATQSSTSGDAELQAAAATASATSGKAPGSAQFVLYHGTSASSADAIVDEQLRPSSGGCLGPGIYLAEFDKAQRFALAATKRGLGTMSIVFKVNVMASNVLRIEGDDSAGAWRQAGHDAVYTSRTSRSTNPEWCVDPERGLVAVVAAQHAHLLTGPEGPWVPISNTGDLSARMTRMESAMVERFRAQAMAEFRQVVFGRSYDVSQDGLSEEGIPPLTAAGAATPEIVALQTKMAELEATVVTMAGGGPVTAPVEADPTPAAMVKLQEVIDQQQAEMETLTSQVTTLQTQLDAKVAEVNDLAAQLQAAAPSEDPTPFIQATDALGLDDSDRAILHEEDIATVDDLAVVSSDDFHAIGIHIENKKHARLLRLTLEGLGMNHEAIETIFAHAESRELHCALNHLMLSSCT